MNLIGVGISLLHVFSVATITKEVFLSQKRQKVTGFAMNLSIQLSSWFSIKSRCLCRVDKRAGF